MGIPLCRTKKVKWSLTSKEDPRWDNSGIGIVAMIFQTAPKAALWMIQCKKRYGKVPKDLEYVSYCV